MEQRCSVWLSRSDVHRVHGNCNAGSRCSSRGLVPVAGLLPPTTFRRTLSSQGDITRIIPHRATGRADYFGPPVNRAARFLAASAPGQILAERSLVEEVLAAVGSREQVGETESPKGI